MHTNHSYTLPYYTTHQHARNAQLTSSLSRYFFTIGERTKRQMKAWYICAILPMSILSGGNVGCGVGWSDERFMINYHHMKKMIG